MLPKGNAMKTFLMTITLFLMCISSYASEIKSPVKSIYLDSEANSFAKFEGRWHALVKKQNPLIPELNSVTVICNKNTMICIESMALLFTERDKVATPMEGFLAPQSNKFKVVEWTSSLIRAREEAPVADIELRISLGDKSVERSFSETTARGVTTSNPHNVQHWVLE